MADDEPEQEQGEGQTETEAPKKSKLVLLIGGIVILGVGIGAGALFFLADSPESPTKGSETVDTETPEKPASAEPSPTQDTDPENKSAENPDQEENTQPEEPTEEAKELPPTDKSLPAVLKTKKSINSHFELKNFRINLENAKKGLFISFRIVLAYKEDNKQKTELESRRAFIRDSIIEEVSKWNRRKLLSIDGLDTLRLQLLNRLNEKLIYPIESVYLTDFLIE